MKQLPLDLKHRTALGREDFLISSANQDAVAWVDKWPNWTAPALIVSGPPACGKTHLASVWSKHCDAVALSHDNIVEYDADSLSQKGENLVIDRLEAWIGDQEIETKLFHLYNILKAEDRTMLLISRTASAHMDFKVADLASRLRAAPCVSISPPDDTLLGALLVKLFSDRQIVLSHDVLMYILPRMERSFAEAQKLVEQADQLALSEKRAISIPLIRRILMGNEQLELLPG
jgi:DnaA regulatory inactivator Hda